MTDAPLLLLPLRIETMPALDQTEALWVRAWPDQIHLDLLRRSISDAEAQAMEEWRLQSRDDPGAAARRLEDALGVPRSRFLRDADARGVDLPRDDGLGAAPVARGLPDRLVVAVTTADGRTHRTEGAPIPEAVPVGPGEEDETAFDGSKMDPLLWMQDFTKAKEIGLAVSIPVPNAGRGAVRRIVVAGLPRGDGADADQRRLSELLAAHAGSDGLGTMAAGRATKGSSGPDRRGERRPGLGAALGLPPGGVAGDLLDRAGDAAAGPMHALAWQAALRPALIDGWVRGVERPTVEPEVIDRIGTLFRDGVRPQGAYPAVLVGAQPYGVHPLLPPGAAREGSPAHIMGGLVDRMAAAGRERVATAKRTGWAGLLDALTHNPTSEAVRLRRLHPLLSWLNAAAAAGGRGRALRDAIAHRGEKLDAMGLAALREAAVGPTIGADPTALLYTRPLVPGHDPDGSGDPAALREGLDAIARWRSLTLEQVFGGSGDRDDLRERAAGSMLELMALSALRWGLLELAAIGRHGPDREAVLRALAPEPAWIQPGGGWRRHLGEGFGMSPEDTPVQRALEAADSFGSGRDLRLALDGILSLRDALDGLGPDQVADALSGALDAGSHRFDAWLSADAAAQIDAHRTRVPEGLHLGAWAILEGDGSTSDEAPMVFHAAPSSDHAITAAVLHEAREASEADGTPGPFGLDLTSWSVRDARWLARAVREGRDPAAHLGEVAAAILADEGRADLVRPLAAAFPLRGGPERPGAPPDDSRIDGHALLDHLEGPDGATVSVSVNDIPVDLPPEARDRIAAALDRTVTGYHDLLAAEGLHAAANGRNAAAAAAFEALAGGGPPPEVFSVLGVPPVGVTIATRVAIASGAEDPIVALRDLAAALAGPPVGDATARLEGADGRKAVIRVTLSDLGIDAFDIVAASPPGTDPNVAFRAVIAAHLAGQGMRGVLRHAHANGAAWDWLWACGVASEALYSARPLRPEDLSTEHAEVARQPDAVGAVNAVTDMVERDPAAAVAGLLGIARPVLAERLATALLAGTVDGDPTGALESLAAVLRDHEDDAARAAHLWPGLPMPTTIRAPTASSLMEPDAPDMMRMTAWLDGMQNVADRLAPLSDLLLAGADTALSVRIEQGPDGGDSGAMPRVWVGLVADSAALTGMVETVVTFQTPRTGGETRTGLLVADWTETLPRPETDAALAARLPIPPGRAGNAVVLCPPVDGLALDDPNAMLGIVERLIYETAMRVVDLSTLPGDTPPVAGEPVADNLGLFLPLLWLPPAPEDPMPEG